VVQFDATSAGRLAEISSNEICVAFVVVQAMVVADSQVALENAPLQAPAKGTIMAAGGSSRVSFQSLGHCEPLK
jgi:hypothetical protein